MSREFDISSRYWIQEKQVETVKYQLNANVLIDAWFKRYNRLGDRNPEYKNKWFSLCLIKRGTCTYFQTQIIIENVPGFNTFEMGCERLLVNV